MKENITAYVILIKKGKLTLDQVPEEFKEEVKKQGEQNEQH
jgi:ABC-type multidrug transport system ATPase subunit